MKLRFTNIRAVLVLIFTFVLFSCTEKSATTIYLVRHAEKDLMDTTDNPPLTEEGERRAVALETLLKAENITGIYSTTYQRNMHTVEPLATAKNMLINTYETHDFKGILDTISTVKNGVYVICGHINNLMPMIDYLGGKKPKNEMAEDEYGTIYKVIITDKNVNTEIVSY